MRILFSDSENEVQGMRLFTKDRSFYRSLLSLAIPVALQNLITFAVSFADNVMVSSLGDSAVSGVYMANQLQTFLQMFSGGVEATILILAAQYWGKRDTKSIKNIVSFGIRVSVAVGSILTVVCLLFPSPIISLLTKEASVISDGSAYLRKVCLSYIFFCITQSLIAAMRSVEIAKTGMYVSLCSLFINVGLNYILIFGKLGASPMGLQGAAIATLISRVAECLIITVYVLFFDKRLGMRVKDFFKTDRVITRDFIKYSIPVISGNIVWSINLMTNSAILGRFSEEVISAVSVANTMNSLAYIAINGMSSAVGIITGKTIGEGKTELIKEYARTTQILFLLLGIMTGGLIFTIRAPFIALYKGISADAAVYSMQFINVLAVTSIGTSYQAACLAGLVKAGGDVGFVFKNDTIFVFCVVIPSALIALNAGAPAWIVFACLKCDQILKCIVAYFKINSFNWIKDLARDAK